MNYLIAVLPDRMQAEAAYCALEKEGLPMKQVSILGRGYKTADAGCTFSLITELKTFAWAGEIGDHLIGGVLGAIAGAMGSVFVGGAGGMAFGSGDALPYRNRLNAGKFLIAVKGTDDLTGKAANILQQFEPENMQGYTET
ncbi:MAG: hypothetical protein EAZ98_00670 [Oscillatoriales cyanobacterium]|nr:MAG: hypothetical protein EAZ98_00670 [Oscillatoriales cyanobacterium]